MSRSPLRSVVFTSACALILGCATGALAAPWDLPCEIGPFRSSAGTLGSGPNGPQDPAKAAHAMEMYRDSLATYTGYDALGLRALNKALGYSHNHRWRLGLNFTWYEFEERNDASIPEIEATLAVLDLSYQWDGLSAEAFDARRNHPKRMRRFGVRIPHLDFRDADPAGPFAASGLFDPEVYLDIGFSWDRKDNQLLTGLLLESFVTLPIGNENRALGRGDITVGARPRWFVRWTPDEFKKTGVRFTQFQFSAGIGYVLDLGTSENSYWSPVVGLWAAISDTVFLELEVQGELHDSGIDQVDASLSASVGLLPDDRSHQVYLMFGASAGLKEDGLRTELAPTVGVAVTWGRLTN